MLERTLFIFFKYSFLILAGIVFVILFFVSAGYGRFNTKKWGPQMGNTAGWIAMEAASPLLFFVIFFKGYRHVSAVQIAFLVIWEIHYLHRAFIYPFLIRGNKTIPVSIVGMGFIFNLVNSYLQGTFLFSLAAPYPENWFGHIPFISGLTMFLAGFILNIHSDHILRHLRKKGENGYSIPAGGMFRFVSCPNYLGEIMEWIGWALLTWSLVGLIFALWTMANLIPRAVSYQKWYIKRFPDYPKSRRAIIPFVL